MPTTSDLVDQAYVYIHLPGTGYVPAGLLRFEPRGGERTARSFFRYGRRYLSRPNVLPVDPVRLPLDLGDQEVGTRRGVPLFNVFRDSAPDRWGRKILAVMAGVPVETLTECDILTAAHSPARIGALAYGPDKKGGPKSMAAWCKKDVFARNVEDLETIARIIEAVDSEEQAAIDALRRELPQDEFLRVFAGSLSPVGGGRPKALVREDGIEWVVKFPKQGDAWSEPLVEHAAMTLAAKCGIHVASTRVERIRGEDVLFVRRFDREDDLRRHMISGFTLGDLREDGEWGSYQDLALAARRYGDDTAGEQLYRRMIFNILCSNTDDHPRNHAFFVSQSSVRMTPAFDIVPQRFTLDRYELALGLGTQGRVATLENAMTRPEPFGLNKEAGQRVISAMIAVVSGWDGHFQEHGVSQRDRDILRHRFQQAAEPL